MQLTKAPAPLPSDLAPLAHAGARAAVTVVAPTTTLIAATPPALVTPPNSGQEPPRGSAPQAASPSTHTRPAQPPQPPPPPRRATLPSHLAPSAQPRPPAPSSLRPERSDASRPQHGASSAVSAKASATPDGVSRSNPAVAKGSGGKSETSGSGMRRLLDDIDDRFETILSSPQENSELTPDELNEAQRLFREIATSYLAPVRALMIELSIGEPNREWLALCRPSLASLKRAAQDMLLTELAAALLGLESAMEQAERSNATQLDARTREALRAAYQPLVTLLPEAFAVDDERDRREPIIVQALLRQVPDVRKVALDRLFAAGLLSLDAYFKAKPSDLTEAAGIPREVAERIVARFQRYRRELGSLPPAAKNAREFETLDALTRKLEEQTVSFEEAKRSWNHPGDARRLRQERASTVLEIQLILARLGEAKLVEKLERLAFRSKAEELRRFLSVPKN